MNKICKNGIDNRITTVYNEYVERRVVMSKPIANTEKVTIFLSADTLAKLKESAASRGTTVSGLVRMVVMEYLAKEKE